MRAYILNHPPYVSISIICIVCCIYLCLQFKIAWQTMSVARLYELDEDPEEALAQGNRATRSSAIRAMITGVCRFFSFSKISGMQACEPGGRGGGWGAV